MQKTRQKILQHLREHGDSTVNELSKALDNLTAVTVRHHLDVLRSEGLVGAPVPQKRDTPGRPRYVYSLTDKAMALFPGNVRNLADHLFDEVVNSLPAEQVNVIFEGVATRMAEDLPDKLKGTTAEERMEAVVEHLTAQGYEASWAQNDEGYILHTTNCPYQRIADEREHMCELDMRYISQLLGAVPRRLGRIIEGEESCSYLVRFNSLPEAEIT
jgi:predicted ArsR family transcriptional regulator